MLAATFPPSPSQVAAQADVVPFLQPRRSTDINMG